MDRARRDGPRRHGGAGGTGVMALMLTASISVVPTMTSSVSAQGVDPGSDRPRIGLVLGGGSARGAAHVGVLEVLEELRVPVDVVIGTSMGAVVGGLWASGLSAAELERELLAVDWPAVFRDDIRRSGLSFRRKEEQRRRLLEPELGFGPRGPELPSGLVAGHRLGLLLEMLLLPVLPEHDFDRLPVAFRATATDIGTGELVVMGRGHLPRAIRASMTVPAALTPVEWEGRLLVDGGLVENLPVSVARELGVDVVIAVDVGSELRTREELGSLLGIASQVTRLMTRANSDRALTRDPPDLLIEPDLTPFSTTDFHRSAALAAAGKAATREAADRLRQWSLRPAEYEAWRAAIVARRGGPPVPAFVRVEGPEPGMARRLRERVRARGGEPLDTARLRTDLDGIYGLGGFDRVGLEMVREAGEQGLIVRAVPQALGPTTLRFGLALSDDFAGRGTYRLTGQLLRLGLTPQGGELRLSLAAGDDRRVAGELYQPLSAASPVFVTGAAEHRRRSTLYADGGHATPYRTRRSSLAAGLGAHLGTWGRVTGEAVVDRVDDRPEDEAGGAESFRGWQAAGALRLEVDRLDDATFPRAGGIARVEMVSVPSWPDDAPAHDRVSVDVARVASRGRTTVVLGASGGTALQGRIPRHDQYRLGGFLRLTGLPTDALAGESMVLGRAILLRTVGSADVVRVGFALELGDAWSDNASFSARRLQPGATALASVRTVLGGLHVGVGVTEGGEWAAHLFLGGLAP